MRHQWIEIRMSPAELSSEHDCNKLYNSHCRTNHALHSQPRGTWLHCPTFRDIDIRDSRTESAYCPLPASALLWHTLSSRSASLRHSAAVSMRYPCSRECRPLNTEMSNPSSVSALCIKDALLSSLLALFIRCLFNQSLLSLEKAQRVISQNEHPLRKTGSS